MFIFAIVLCKWIMPSLLGIPEIEIPNPRFSLIRTNFDALLFAVIPTMSLMIAPIMTKNILESNSKIKRFQIIEEQLEFLNSELSQKKTELEELRQCSKKENVTDTTIRSIDNSKYKAILEERLALLSYIKKYRNKLKTCLAQGTLKDRLINMGVTPENISFAEDTLKRVLEKEKVTQHE